MGGEGLLGRSSTRVDGAERFSWQDCDTQESEARMTSSTLKILLTLYILYALLKFFEFYFRDDG